MKIKVAAGNITKLDVDAVVVNLFQGAERPEGATGAVDAALEGAISRLIAQGEIKGKREEVTVIHTLGKIPPARVVVAGLGKREQFNAEVVRQVMGAVSRRLRSVGVGHVATVAHGTGVGGLEPRLSAQAIAEGALLGLYRFREHFSKGEEDGGEIKELTIVDRDRRRVSTLEQGTERGQIIAEAVMLARDMANQPSNYMTPTHMAKVATRVAQKAGLEVQVLDKPQMEELGMGAVLGVARGSTEPPKFIILRYWGDPGNPDNNLGLLGKGITFDSGGISLKPAQGMEEMKTDMAGGGAVIASLQAIARLRPKINVTALVPSTENMPGGSAQKPGDVVRVMSGKTIEVENTDAEGRLVLADALSYARLKLGLRRLVDMATLTGAIVVALGNSYTGAFGNNQEFTDQVLKAAERVGELAWQLPLHDEYKEQNKSLVADMKNTGGRPAGSITAALLLSEFAEDTPWVHLDIAGTARSEKEKGYVVKGATGVPVRTLVQLALDLAQG